LGRGEFTPIFLSMMGKRGGVGVTFPLTKEGKKEGWVEKREGSFLTSPLREETSSSQRKPEKKVRARSKERGEGGYSIEGGGREGYGGGKIRGLLLYRTKKERENGGGMRDLLGKEKERKDLCFRVFEKGRVTGKGEKERGGRYLFGVEEKKKKDLF